MVTVLVLVGTSPIVGTAATRQTGVEPACGVPATAPSMASDARPRRWEGPVSASVSGGVIHVDVRVATAVLTTWDRNRWSVEITGIDPPAAAESLGPLTVRNDTENGTFNLTVYDGAETVPPLRDPATPERGTMARVRVPDLLYREAAVWLRVPDAASTVGGSPTSPRWNGVWLEDLAADEGRFEAQGSNVVIDNVTGGSWRGWTQHGTAVARNSAADEVHLDTHRGPVCVEEVAVGTLTSYVYNGDIQVDSANASLLDVETQGGGISISDVTGRNLSAWTERGVIDVRKARYGNSELESHGGTVTVDDLAGASLDVWTRAGEIRAAFRPTASGQVHLTARSGDAELAVPADTDHGYNATLEAPQGQVSHDLAEVRVIDRGRDWVSIRTEGFDDRSIRTEAELRANGGEVRMAGDGPAAPARDGEALLDPSVEQVGVLAALAAALYYLGPKVKTLGASLYSRIGADDALDNETRQRILEIVREEPGIHFSDIRKRLGTGVGSLEHHLDVLVDHGILVEAPGSGYRCYFEHGSVDRRVMAVADRLRSEVARGLLRAIVERPDDALADIADELGVSPDAAAYHLDRLEEVGLVDRRRDGRSLDLALTDLGRQAGRSLDIL